MKKFLSPPHRRTMVLFLLLLVIGILLILSGSLSDLDLERGKYLVAERTETPPAPGTLEPAAPPPRASPQADVIGVVLRIAFWILIPLAIYVFIFENDRFLKRTVGTLTILVTFLILAKALGDMTIIEDFTPRTPPVTPGPGTVVAPPEAGEPLSQTLAFLVGFLLVLGLLVAGLILWRRVRSQWTTEEKIKQQAREALDDLSRGEAIENTILRCYQEMARTLAEEQGITREKSMTPREFEQRLVSEGFPEAPVLTLTRLFESVRYGGKSVSADQEQDAVRSLEAITGQGGSDAE